MSEDRAVGLMVLLVMLPGLAWALGDYRSGTARLMLFSRMRNSVSADRESSPRRFWGYTVFNALLFALMLAGGLLLMVKP